MLEGKPLDILKKDIKKYKMGLLIALVYMLLMSLLFNNVCPSKLILGLPCPGCGLTRACFHTLTLNFKEAARINASCVLWMILIIEGIIQRYLLRRKFNKINMLALIIVGILTVLYFIYRVFWGILPLDI